MFDYRPGDIFACVADIGWITGHSHALYGPLINGGTSVLFESIPIYPDPGEREREAAASKNNLEIKVLSMRIRSTKKGQGGGNALTLRQ